FMCRPKLPNVMSSGWHLHQSVSRGGKNVFASPDQDLSEEGQRWLAGLLAHDRVVWGQENRGALLRVIGGPGNPATRIENRIGEPAANPYLYFASQVHSGLDGMATRP